jgi:hypothetical protein
VDGRDNPGHDVAKIETDKKKPIEETPEKGQKEP